MKIEVSHYDTDVAVVTLYGEHDLTSKEALDQTLRSLVRSGEQIIINLSVVEFIDSSASKGRPNAMRSTR